jgi:flagellar biosynthetic protein FliP
MPARAAGRALAAIGLAGGLTLGLAGAAFAAGAGLPAVAASDGIPASPGAPASHGVPASPGVPASHVVPASPGVPASHRVPASHGVPAPYGVRAVPAPAGLPAAPDDPSEPSSPSGTDTDTGSDTGGETGTSAGNVTLGVPGRPSTVLQIILLVTVLGIAPSVLLLCTAFTKIVVVLSLARSALGTPSIPPNQVLIGLALFLSLFVMGPTIDQIQAKAIKPYTAGDLTAVQAYRAGSDPLRGFMTKHTRDEELALMTKAADLPAPKDTDDVELRTLIPAFVLSELRGAFIIGFVIFIPFLVIDIVVSAILMSLGMVMLPPSLVSLPFKLLLFVLVDGWSLIVTALIGSYH